MASEGLEGELAAVLGGQGLCVHSCDSEPAGELLAPVQLRRNVCYVVLAVCLNEQVSLSRRPPPQNAQPGRGDRGPTSSCHHLFVSGVSQFCKALSH